MQYARSRVLPRRNGTPLVIVRMFGGWLLAILCAAAWSFAASAQLPPAMVDDDDPAMNAAIAKARKSLPQFWETYKAGRPEEGQFSLKVLITDSEGGEHFWLGDIKSEGGQLSGTIDNEPAIVKSVKMGQRYQFEESQISDWLFMRNGKMVGNETLRALILRLPKEEADEVRAWFETP